MRIGNRLFPYPVLNNNQALSDYYEDVNFELVFDDSKDIQKDGYLRLDNIRIQSGDEYLNQLARDGRVKGLLIVECSILAADDTLHVDVDNQPNNDNKNSSIFTIVLGRDDGETMRCQSGASTGKIEIILPPKYYANYMTLRSAPGLLNASFAAIAIPVLTERLMDIQGKLKEEGFEDCTLDDICAEYRWFRAVMKAFERVKGRQLTVEYLKNEVYPMELAQIILNNSTCKGIEELSTIAINGTDVDNEELSNE